MGGGEYSFDIHGLVCEIRERMKASIPSTQPAIKAHRLAQGLALGACVATLFLTSQLAQAKEAITATKGETYYTQFTLCYEELRHLTTNYRKGVLVPVNTEVTFVKSTSGEIHVKLLDGLVLRIENVREFSGEDIVGIFKRTFGKEKVNLDKFSATDRENILLGNIEVGMSKDAVIKAYGYPPRHQTPSLDGNQWRYWRNRFATSIVQFKDGKLAEIQK